MTCEVGEACCRKDRETATFDFVSARGAENEGVRGRVFYDWEKVSTEGPLAQGSSFLGRVMELDVERRPTVLRRAKLAALQKTHWKWVDPWLSF